MERKLSTFWHLLDLFQELAPKIGIYCQVEEHRMFREDKFFLVGDIQTIWKVHGNITKITLYTRKQEVFGLNKILLENSGSFKEKYLWNNIFGTANLSFLGFIWHYSPVWWSLETLSICIIYLICTLPFLLKEHPNVFLFVFAWAWYKQYSQLGFTSVELGGVNWHGRSDSLSWLDGLILLVLG